MTERLYYADSYLADFTATLLRLERDADNRHVAVLDRTAFYPTSGGQPFDTGSLGDARVVDVVDAGDGTIRHIVDRSIEPGPLAGRIDWGRRFEHMQQHTGQHVLSAAFDRLFGVRTVSFHLGSISSTIDLAREVSAAEIARAEDEANRIVWEDHAVTIRFADAAEAAAMPLRKESLREGTLRLIDIDGYDLSACGGTHVARTGAIGIIAIAGSERFKGASRIEFVCGVRALRSHRALRDAVTASIRLVSVLPNELPAGIERLQAEGKDLKRRVKDLQAQLAGHAAKDLAAAAESRGGARVVVAALDGWDPVGLKSIASTVVAEPGHVLVLIGAPAPFSIVAARSSDVSVDCGALLKEVVAKFGGKGGGRPELAQGGGLQGSPDEILAFLTSAVLA